MTEISINEIEGFLLGNAEDAEGGTGCTAICCPEGAVASVDVRGGGPATRETDLLDPVKMMDRVHCVMIGGGSAFGLAAADGAVRYLEEHDIGFDTGWGKVPIVTAACLFDLICGDPKCRPGSDMGYRALENAQKRCLTGGNVGAGTGATVGKLFGIEWAMKSGLGIFAGQYGALKIGAVVAVNALGDIVDPFSGKVLAGLLDEDKKSFDISSEAIKNMIPEDYNAFSSNTTLCCVITNAALTKVQAKKVAEMAHDGYARAINPVHTTADGDSIFVMSHGDVPVHLDVAGALAAEVTARAVARAAEVHSAYGYKGRLDL